MIHHLKRLTEWSLTDTIDDLISIGYMVTDNIIVVSSIIIITEVKLL